MRPVVLRFLMTVAVLACTAAAAEPPAAYALPDTEVRELHSSKLNRDYRLYISLPPSYAKEQRSYPVVFVTDAPYAFPVARAIGARVAGHSDALPEFIVVGLSYAVGDTPEFSRRRDYTPTSRPADDVVSDMPGRAPVFGEAEAYRRFIADEVFPFIAAHYRADMQRKVFAGHSYGALFGAHVLMTAPAMFEGYVLGSPSLWYGDRVLLRARWPAAAQKDVHADVYLGVGALEAAPRGARAGGDSDMVADTRAFGRALQSAASGRLRVRTEVVAGEDHLTVAPILLTHGLLWTLGKQPPGTR